MATVMATVMAMVMAMVSVLGLSQISMTRTPTCYQVLVGQSLYN